jgi:hypothetical protein
MGVACLVILPCMLLFAPESQAWAQQGSAGKAPADTPAAQPPAGGEVPAPMQKKPARKSGPDARQEHGPPPKAGQPVRLPAHREGDTGKPADTTKLHDVSRIEDASAGIVREEHRIVPIAPAPFAPAAAATPLSPPERQVVPVVEPAAPTDESVPAVENTVTSAEETAATAVKLATAAAKLAATAAKLAATAAKLAAAAQANAAKSGQRTPGSSPAAGTLPRVSTAPAVAPTAREPTPPAKPQPAVPEKPETVTLDEAVFDQIRGEIKRRLPYFQACADAARRRGSSDVRRVSATWTIAADGAIKEMKVDGVPDPQLATCITRMGSHPFAVQPGTELTIPTPIVFVR